jgi:hypothetical protein
VAPSVLDEALLVPQAQRDGPDVCGTVPRSLVNRMKQQLPKYMPFVDFRLFLSQFPDGTCVRTYVRAAWASIHLHASHLSLYAHVSYRCACSA